MASNHRVTCYISSKGIGMWIARGWRPSESPCKFQCVESYNYLLHGLSIAFTSIWNSGICMFEHVVQWVCSSCCCLVIRLDLYCLVTHSTYIASAALQRAFGGKPSNSGQPPLSYVVAQRWAANWAFGGPLEACLHWAYSFMVMASGIGLTGSLVQLGGQRR